MLRFCSIDTNPQYILGLTPITRARNYNTYHLSSSFGGFFAMVGRSADVVVLNNEERGFFETQVGRARCLTIRSRQ